METDEQKIKRLEDENRNLKDLLLVAAESQVQIAQLVGEETLGEAMRFRAMVKAQYGSRL